MARLFLWSFWIWTRVIGISTRIAIFFWIIWIGHNEYIFPGRDTSLKMITQQGLHIFTETNEAQPISPALKPPSIPSHRQWQRLMWMQHSNLAKLDLDLSSVTIVAIYCSQKRVAWRTFLRLFMQNSWAHGKAFGMQWNPGEVALLLRQTLKFLLSKSHLWSRTLPWVVSWIDFDHCCGTLILRLWLYFV